MTGEQYQAWRTKGRRRIRSRQALKEGQEGKVDFEKMFPKGEILAEEPEKLTDTEIKALYQRMFLLLNERVFNSELPPIEIDYLSQDAPDEVWEYFKDCEACFCENYDGAIIILLSFMWGADYGISKDDIQDLFHELIHYYCYLHRIEDTNPDHKYHNLEFKRISELFGGKCTYNDDINGYNIVELPPDITEGIFNDI